MPFYDYKHPKTDEIFTIRRSMKDRKKVYIAPDGEECEFVSFWVSPKKGTVGVITSGGKEVFEAFPNDVKKMNPKKIKFRDGHKEKYDQTKHHR